VPKGPRQKTICSLGDLGARSREEWLKLTGKIEDALVGQGNMLATDDAEVADIVRPSAYAPAGPPNPTESQPTHSTSSWIGSK
jgi:hypothetical protein